MNTHLVVVVVVSGGLVFSRRRRRFLASATAPPLLITFAVLAASAAIAILLVATGAGNVVEDRLVRAGDDSDRVLSPQLDVSYYCVGVEWCVALVIFFSNVGIVCWCT